MHFSSHNNCCYDGENYRTELLVVGSSLTSYESSNKVDLLQCPQLLLQNHADNELVNYSNWLLAASHPDSYISCYE